MKIIDEMLTGFIAISLVTLIVLLLFKFPFLIVLLFIWWVGKMILEW